MPSYNCIKQNAQALARYAALCVEGGLVPIVEPELLMDGDHDIDACEMVTEWMLKEVYQELYYAKVPLEQTVLKPNMVIAGKKCPKQASRQEVAERTVKVLKRCVPPAVPGIAFLSGGQSDEDATAHLSLMNQLGPLPWKLSFSYGRALQAARAEGLGRQVGERGRRPARLHAPRQDERRRHARQMGREAGEGGLIAFKVPGSPAAPDLRRRYALGSSASCAWPMARRSFWSSLAASTITLPECTARTAARGTV